MPSATAFLKNWEVVLCIRQGLDGVSHLKRASLPFISLNAKLHKNDIILSCGDGCELCFSPVNHKEFKEVNGIGVTKSPFLST